MSARVFLFFRHGQEIIMTNGYMKKQQKVDIGELERACRYKKDWEERHIWNKRTLSRLMLGKGDQFP